MLDLIMVSIVQNQRISQCHAGWNMVNVLTNAIAGKILLKYQLVVCCLSTIENNTHITFYSSDMVKISMDTFVKRFQRDKYDAWINGQDIGPHPEDPPSAAKPAPLPSDQDILVNKK